MIAKVVVTALLAAMFAFAGLIKVVGVRQSLAIRDHLGVRPVQWRMIGALELAGVAGVLVGPGVAADRCGGRDRARATCVGRHRFSTCGHPTARPTRLPR